MINGLEEFKKIIKLGERETNLPVDLPDCYIVGLAGGCGKTCPIYVAGQCEVEDEINCEVLK